MNKVHELLIKKGYKYDEEDDSYEKNIYSDSWCEAFAPFVRLFTIAIFDGNNVVISYNKSMIYDIETIEKVKSEKENLKEIGLTVTKDE